MRGFFSRRHQVAGGRCTDGRSRALETGPGPCAEAYHPGLSDRPATCEDVAGVASTEAVQDAGTSARGYEELRLGSDSTNTARRLCRVGLDTSVARYRSP